MSSLKARIPLLALAATAGSIAAVSLALSRPEALIDRSLNAALSRVAPAGTGARTAAMRSDEVEAGLLKLSSTGATAGVPADIGQTLAVGDRITIAAKDGARRTLEVAEVRPLADTAHTGADGARGLLLVTCNVLGGEPGQVVRFVIEDAGDHAPALPATQHRAL